MKKYIVIILIIFIVGILLYSSDNTPVIQAKGLLMASGVMDAGSVSCTWTTIWDGEDVSGDSNWTNYDQADKNYRLIIDAGDTTGSSGQGMRFILRADSSVGTEIYGASIGLGTAGGSGFDGTPTNVQFSSSDTVSMTIGQILTTDNIDIAYDPTEDYLIALSTDGSMDYVNGNPPEAYTYNTSTDETEVQDPLGYVSQPYLEIISVVEACY